MSGPAAGAIQAALLNWSAAQMKRLFDEKRRLAHYTTAAVAHNILKHRQIWMRNAAVMNDFSEIDHGLACIRTALTGEQGRRMRSLLNAVHDDLFEKLLERLAAVGLSRSVRSETYLTCLSEHKDTEDFLGRLSMWRAYGGSSGVALLFPYGSILTSPLNHNVHSSKVTYSSIAGYADVFSEMIDGLEREKAAIDQCTADEALQAVWTALSAAILSIKHQGFEEEQEWRVVYTAALRSVGNPLPNEHQTIRGLPQTIYKLPIPAMRFEYPSLIIGPSDFPETIKDTFVELILEQGIDDAATRVTVSDIPLRK